MKDLIIMYRVDRKNPKGTWSGTSYSLSKALSNYVNIITLDLQEDRVLRHLDKLCIRLGGIARLSHLGLICGTVHDLILSVKANFLLNKYRNNPVLEIGIDVRIHNKYYIYQDLSYAVLADSINELSMNLDKTSGGARINLSDKELQRRIRVQRNEYKKASKVFFMGQWVTKRMKELYPELTDKFLAVGGGLNPEFQVNKRTSERVKENAIIFIGFDFQRKAGDLVMEAFHLLREKYLENASLYIVGPENITMDSKYEEHNIILLGKLDRDKLGAVLEKCKVFCMPSRFEAYGLVFIEALCYGLPCIGRRKYEMPYFIRDGYNGLLIDDDDIAEIAEKMHILLSNNTFQNNVANNTAFYCKQYSWDNVAQRILSSILT